jgi:uncharacterized protein (TIGR03086 family)
MDVSEVFLTGLDTFEGVLQRVTPEDLDKQSPCAKWDARSLAGHVLTVLDSASTVMRGGEFDWAHAPEGASVAGDEPLASFRARAADAREALQQTDLDAVMESPMGPMPVAKRLGFPAMDLHLHAWDLGRTIGVPVQIPAAVAEFVHATLDPLPPEMMRSEGVFGPEVPAPADASITETLVAWTGRQPR